MRFNCSIPTLFLAALVASPLAAVSGTIAISGAKQSVVLDADRAGVEDVIERLSASYGFEVERIGGATAGPAVWGHFEGSLPNILARALGNQSHLILYSAKGGVDKVVLYGPNCTLPGPSNTPDAPAANQSVAQTAASTGRPQPLAREIIPPSAGK